MFPKDAHFICRKCLEQLIIKDDDFRDIEGTGKLTCPACSLETPDDFWHVSTFFKYYPRLVNAIPAMATNGFKPRSFTVEEVRTKQYTGHYLMPDMVYFCRECGEHGLFKIRETRNPARVFQCSNCSTRPRSHRYTQEFFQCFERVHESQLRIFEFQFDLFAQGELNPADFRVQHHLYRKNED